LVILRAMPRDVTTLQTAGCPMSRALRDVGLPQMSAIEGYVLEDGVRRRT
jgi:hypothetical protein